VHALDILDARGTRHPLVMRRYLADGPIENARGLVESEAAALGALEGCSIPAPRLVATDPAGEVAGAPAVLMTRLPGRMLLTPRDPGRWAQQIADAVPAIHAVPFAGAPVIGLRDAAGLEAPGWARAPSLWRAAIAAAREPAPHYEPCFAHGDYQHFNLVWSRETLRGIVDWTFSGLGMPERDVGHCRLNFAILWGADAAEGFRHRYESVAGRATDPYWDLQAALGYLPGGWGAFIQVQAGRRLRVDTAGIDGRVEDLVATIMRRL
jgi:aminoglycoside phosphotransferase (APT) family kinase protein